MRSDIGESSWELFDATRRGVATPMSLPVDSRPDCLFTNCRLFGSEEDSSAIADTLTETYHR